MQHPSEMSPADLLCAREGMGLSITELAVVLGLDAREQASGPALERSQRQPGPLHPRTVKRWERGGGISAPNAAAFARLLEHTEETAQEIVDGHRPGEPIVTYLDDAAFHAGGGWPALTARWHRAVAKRAKDRTGARIVYAGHDE